MASIAKIIKKAAAGVLVAGLAVFTVAATNAESKDAETVKTERVVKAGMIDSEFLVNLGTAGFQTRPSVDPENSCNVTSSYQCTYIVTEEGMENIPNKPSYTPADIDEYLAEVNWLEPHPDSKEAQYTP